MPIDARSEHSSPQSRATFSWFLLISANILWATSYVAGKLALQSTSVILMLALRMGLSALILLPFLIVKTTAIAYLAWFQGLVKVDASVAASTLFIQPLLGTLLAIVLLHNQLTSMTIMGGLLIIVCHFKTVSTYEPRGDTYDKATQLFYRC